MAAVFFLPRATLLDAAGAIATAGSVRFFNATTTTPRTVYSDSGLSVAILQPIAADSAGRLPKIYIATGAYKVVYYSDAAGSAVVYTEDNCDTGIPAGSGALAVANGGTGSTTAAAARSALGAASQTDVDTLSTDVAAIDAQITAVGGTLGTLAGLSTVARGQLAAGFGIVDIQRTEVAASTALVTAAGNIPFDDTKPQISEGTQVLTGSFTPLSASSALELQVTGMVSANGAHPVCIALFQNTALDAIEARWVDNETASAGNPNSFHFTSRMASPGTSPITFSLRIGCPSGTAYLNGGNAARVGGGTTRSSVYVIERLTF